MAELEELFMTPKGSEVSRLRTTELENEKPEFRKHKNLIAFTPAECFIYNYCIIIRYHNNNQGLNIRVRPLGHKDPPLNAKQGHRFLQITQTGYFFFRFSIFWQNLRTFKIYTSQESFCQRHTFYKTVVWKYISKFVNHRGIFTCIITLQIKYWQFRELFQQFLEIWYSPKFTSSNYSAKQNWPSVKSHCM